MFNLWIILLNYCFKDIFFTNLYGNFYQMAALKCCGHQSKPPPPSPSSFVFSNYFSIILNIVSAIFWPGCPFYRRRILCNIVRSHIVLQSNKKGRTNLFLRGITKQPFYLKKLFSFPIPQHGSATMCVTQFSIKRSPFLSWKCCLHCDI